jgi:hypothetical protein
MRETDNRYCPRCKRSVEEVEASICETHKVCGAILMPDVVRPRVESGGTQAS